MAFASACADDPAGPCPGRPGECTNVEDGASIAQCEDTRWVVQSCADICTAEHPDARSRGCVLLTDGDVTCHCDLPDDGPPVCLSEYPPPDVCFDGGLRHCVGATVVEASCEDVCAQESEGARAVGCFHDADSNEGRCECVRPDDACDVVGYETCVGDDLLHCAGDAWVQASCADLCAPATTAGCVTTELGVGVCVCDDASTTSTSGSSSE